MHFGETGNIVIDDTVRDRQVLGYAVAFGLNGYEDMREMEVDTSPRPLDAEESVALVHGLARMEQIARSPSVAAHAVKVGGKVMEDVLEQAHRAVPYLKEIALQAVTQPRAAPQEFMYR